MKTHANRDFNMLGDPFDLIKIQLCEYYAGIIFTGRRIRDSFIKQNSHSEVLGGLK
jgi:hypothetical protein